MRAPEHGRILGNHQSVKSEGRAQGGETRPPRPVALTKAALHFIKIRWNAKFNNLTGSTGIGRFLGCYRNVAEKRQPDKAASQV
jgi:hypothetical protein